MKANRAYRVIVSRDGHEVFCYAATREQVEAARKAIVELAGQHGWEAQFALHRWHPVAERWEDPDAPLPSTGQEVAAEHATRDEIPARP